MCGRARCTLAADDFARACTVNNTRSVQMDRYRPRYNVSPGAYMPVVRREDGGNDGFVLHCMKWGLVPSFTKSTDKADHYKMFNARSESVYEKPSFRRLLPKNRCLVVVDGFFEWKKDGSKKQPYYIHFKDGRPLVFAALYDSWGDVEGELLYTFTILTTSCSSALQWLHDRMPVLLGNKSSIDAWLSGSCGNKFSAILKPYEDSDLAWYPVTPAMGKTSFDGPECIVEIPLKDEEKNLISKFFVKKKVEIEQESSPQPKTSAEDESLKKEKVTLNLVSFSAEKHGTKSESYSGNTENAGTNVNKKRKLENADQKQPTLLSYFGRK